VRTLDSHVLLVSGRGVFEIVQKTMAAAVPVRASMSAPPSFAVQLARQGGVALVDEQVMRHHYLQLIRTGHSQMRIRTHKWTDNAVQRSPPTRRRRAAFATR
jgi:FdhD/NarQ family protein